MTEFKFNSYLMTETECIVEQGIKFFIEEAHKAAIASGWWSDESNEYFEADVPRALMLTVRELSEALEADRKNLMDDKLPARLGIEVELADAMIRIADLAGRLNLDVHGAIIEKMAYNAQREDFTAEARAKTHGKKY